MSELFLLPLREKVRMRGDSKSTLTFVLSRQGRGNESGTDLVFEN
jgi:hypothetical protein